MITIVNITKTGSFASLVVKMGLCCCWLHDVVSFIVLIMSRNRAASIYVKQTEAVAQSYLALFHQKTA